METWTTSDGQKIAIRDMTDRHLLNTHRFLGRQVRDASASHGACQGMVFLGEQASFEADRAADRLFDAVIALECKQKVFAAEIERRGLVALPDDRK